MSLILASTLASSFFIFFIGLLAFFHNRKSFSNIIFLLISLDTVLWAIANLFSVTSDPQHILMWVRLVLFFAVPHVFLFILFIFNFPSQKLQVRKLLVVLLIILMLALMYLTLTPYVFSGLVYVDGSPTPVPGVLIPAFAMSLIGFLLLTFVVMIKNYVRAEYVEKMQWRAMLFGTSLSYILLITTQFLFIILLKNTFFVSFAPLFILPTILGTAYAILRHNLMHVKVIASEMLVFVILIISLIELFLSEGWWELIFRSIMFLLVFFFSMLLIKSILNEVKQREKLEELTKKLQKASEKLKYSNKQLEVANKELERLDQAKSEFLSIASHQLRTPTTAIKGYSSMLLEGSFGKMSAKVKEAVNKVFLSSDRLINLIESLLNISRIEAGRIEFNMEPVDLNKTIADIVESFQKKAKDRKLTLEFHPDDNVPEASADPEKVKEVISNVIDNALKYTTKGGVTVGLHAEGQSVVFTSVDTGVGIATEDLPRLFNKFVRGTGANKVNTEGTGLGLYFARMVAENMGGRIWAESPGKGQGSKFSFSLPMADKNKAKKIG